MTYLYIGAFTLLILRLEMPTLRRSGSWNTICAFLVLLIVAVLYNVAVYIVGIQATPLAWIDHLITLVIK
ncbi:hypothetical protein [Paenibacillus gansuensis]|uniref:Uncharacterized protein n=1 Tax=Paenibacillus gansuensis TaxID=306542 RepID=A0ABW5PA57_9BACL